jgi:hypothetical protein
LQYYILPNNSLELTKTRIPNVGSWHVAEHGAKKYVIDSTSAYCGNTCQSQSAVIVIAFSGRHCIVTGGGFGIVISGGIEKNSFFQRVSTAATLKRMMR